MSARLFLATSVVLVACPVLAVRLWGTGAVPVLVHWSGTTTDWVSPAEWATIHAAVVGLVLATEAVVLVPLMRFPHLPGGRVPHERYWRSTPGRQRRLGAQLRSSYLGTLGMMNLALAVYLSLCVIAAVTGTHDLGNAVQVVAGLGGIIVIALLAHDLLVRYRPSEDA